MIRVVMEGWTVSAMQGAGCWCEELTITWSYHVGLSIKRAEIQV
jgi:hypothetical protein